MTTKRTPFWRNPRFRYGSLSTLLLCVMLAALLGLNLLTDALEKKHGWRVDYSFNAITTQSEQTLEVLAQLEHPVHIYALFSKGYEDLPLMELLDRYSAASDLVTWEQTDVSLNPGLLTSFQSAESEQVVSNDSLIVHCPATGRFRILSPMEFISLSYNYQQGVYEIAGLTYESKITSAIRYVTQEKIPRIMVLQGHGELDEAGTAVFAELMEGNQYEVRYFTFADQDVSLQPGDMLALLSPVRDLNEAELALITDFAGQGGSILFTCDYSDPIDRMPNYAALLRSYGFVPKEGIVVASAEEPASYYNQRLYIIPQMISTDVTADLVEADTDTLLMAGARAFETPDGSDRNLMVTPVLASGYKAYLRTFTNASYSIDQTDEDELGPFALGLQARRVTEDGFVSRAFVLGCSTVLTDAQVHAMTDSQEFILRVAEFLLDTAPADLNIMAKAAMRPQLSVDSVALGSVLIVALPVGVLAVALIVLHRRRSR